MSFRLCRLSVQTGDKVEFSSLSWSTVSPRLNVFDSVDFIQKRVIFVAQMLNVFRHSVDFVEFDKIDNKKIEKKIENAKKVWVFFPVWIICVVR